MSSNEIDGLGNNWPFLPVVILPYIHAVPLLNIVYEHSALNSQHVHTHTRTHVWKVAVWEGLQTSARSLILKKWSHWFRKRLTGTVYILPYLLALQVSFWNITFSCFLKIKGLKVLFLFQILLGN